jgi:hypothetical protein
MTYLVIKYVNQFQYYLTNSGEWTGVINNAKIFLSSEKANNYAKMYGGIVSQNTN